MFLDFSGVGLVAIILELDLRFERPHVLAFGRTVVTIRAFCCLFPYLHIYSSVFHVYISQSNCRLLWSQELVGEWGLIQ
jgi:hypothetical protein